MSSPANPAIRALARTRLENELEQQNDDHQPDQEDDADGTTEKLEHVELRKMNAGACEISGKPTVG